MNKELFYKSQGVIYERVTKTTARKFYDKGCNIIIAPINANMYYNLCNLWTIHNKNISGMDFDLLINNYSFYNLNNGLGKYAKFFVNKYDIDKEV